MVHVPFGEGFGVWRGDRRVFQSFEHKLNCIRSELSIPQSDTCGSALSAEVIAIPAFRFGAVLASMERMNTFLADLRFGVRTLRSSPGFAACAILALALGIGANVAVFSVVDAMLVRPLQFRDAGRLVDVWEDGSY